MLISAVRRVVRNAGWPLAVVLMAQVAGGPMLACLGASAGATSEMEHLHHGSQQPEAPAGDPVDCCVAMPCCHGSAEAAPDYPVSEFTLPVLLWTAELPPLVPVTKTVRLLPPSLAPPLQA